MKFQIRIGNIKLFRFIRKFRINSVTDITILRNFKTKILIACYDVSQQVPPPIRYYLKLEIRLRLRIYFCRILDTFGYDSRVPLVYLVVN